MFSNLLTVTKDIAVSSKMANNSQQLKRGQVVETVADCVLIHGAFKIRRLRLKDFKGWITGTFTNADGKSIDLMQLITWKVLLQGCKKSISDKLFGEEDTFDFRIGLFQHDIETVNAKAVDASGVGGGLYDIDVDDSDNADNAAADDDDDDDDDEDDDED